MRIKGYDIYAHEREVNQLAQKKMGRPLSGDKPLKDRIFVLVDDDTKRKLEVCRKELNTTTSDIVRKGIDRIYDDLGKK